MKKKTAYVCGNCGYDSAKWLGQCPACHEWNTMSEFTVKEDKRNSLTVGALQKSKNKPMAIEDIDLNSEVRVKTGISELDRVLGGGFVKGSLTLISGGTN